MYGAIVIQARVERQSTHQNNMGRNATKLIDVFVWMIAMVTNAIIIKLPSRCPIMSSLVTGYVPYPGMKRKFSHTAMGRWKTTCQYHTNNKLFSAVSSTEQHSPQRIPLKFVPYPFSYRETIELRIETLTNQGLGVGRVEIAPRPPLPSSQSLSEKDYNENTTPKWVIMVPNVIPGEIVRVSVFRNHKNYSEADLVQVLESSPHRVEPRCSLAGVCGGCQFQHMDIKLQREWKTQHVKDALIQYHIDENIFVNPCSGTDEIYGYRSKITPHYDAPAKSRRGTTNENRTKETIKAIGFQRQTARQIIDVETCPIATPEVNVAYRKVRKELLERSRPGKKGATLLFRQGNLGDEYIETNHNNMTSTTVRGLRFTYAAGNFFQNNYFVLPLMVNSVLEQATLGGCMTHLADCYCGSGLFAISAARHFQLVVGIEINSKAIAEATENTIANKISNCEFKAASAEDIFSGIQDFPRDKTVVVVDPPRKGCSTEFLDQLCAFSPQRIVYMSCDPTTQARDAAIIIPHGYKISYVQPFDLFPQTRHIECLMVLEKM